MNKKKVMLWLIIGLLIMSVGVIGVSAVGRTPVKDTTCYPTIPSPQCFNGFGIQPGASLVGGVCSVSQNGYVGWDLTGVASTINTAQVTFTTYNVVGATAAPIVFELYEPGGPWTVDGDDPGPQTGNGIVTASVVLTGPNQTVTFGGDSGADALALGAYFDGKRGGEASVGIRIVGGCSQSTVALLNDMENTGGLQGDTQPDLILRSPTAVAVDSFSANNGVSPVVWVGLLLVVVLGLGAFVTMRRRDSAAG
jgi:hypothetical protein